MGQQNNNNNNNNSHDQSKKWAELHERIQSMTDAVDVVNDAMSSSANDLNGSFQLMDAVQRLDARSFACLDQPIAIAIAIAMSASTATSTANSTDGNGNAKSSSKGSKSSSKTSSKSSSKSN